MRRRTAVTLYSNIEGLGRTHIYIPTLVTLHSGSDVTNQSDFNTGMGCDVDGQQHEYLIPKIVLENQVY
jgi:hypothetical protein